MKRTILLTILLAAILLPLMPQLLIPSTPDTVWTYTYPDNRYFYSCQLSPDGNYAFVHNSKGKNCFDAITGDTLWLKGRLLGGNFYISKDSKFIISNDFFFINYYYLLYPDSLYSENVFFDDDYGTFFDSTDFDKWEFPEIKAYCLDDSERYLYVIYTQKYTDTVSTWPYNDFDLLHSYRSLLYRIDTSGWVITHKDTLQNDGDLYWYDNKDTLRGLMNVPNTNLIQMFCEEPYGATRFRYLNKNDLSFVSEIVLPDSTDDWENRVYDYAVSKSGKYLYLSLSNDNWYVYEIQTGNLKQSLHKRYFTILPTANDSIIITKASYSHGSITNDTIVVWNIFNDVVLDEITDRGDSLVVPGACGIIDDGTRLLTVYYNQKRNRTVLMMLNTDIYSSVEPEEKEPTPLLFPNPATGEVNINIPPSNKRGTGAVSVKIYDVLGIEQHVSFTATPLSEGNLRLDVSSLPAGVYFVRVGGQVLKFVKL